MGHRLAVLAIATAAGLPTAALAHHSFAAFDRSRQGVVTGTMKEWQWTNPHTWLFVEVGPVDKPVEYAFEGYSPLMLPRFGVTRGAYKPGDKVTVTFFPRKDHSNGGQFVGIAHGDAPSAPAAAPPAAAPSAPEATKVPPQ